MLGFSYDAAQRGTRVWRPCPSAYEWPLCPHFPPTSPAYFRSYGETQGISGQENTKRYGNTGLVIVPLFCTLPPWGQGMDYGLFSINCQDPILPYNIFTTPFGK